MNDPDSKAKWLAARNRAPDGRWLIGGSELASILGWDPWCDRLKRWAMKRGLLEDTAGEAAEAGTYLEAGVLRWYRDKTGRRLVPPEIVARALQGIISLNNAIDEEMRQLLRVLGQHATVHYGPDHDNRVTFRSKSTPWAILSIDAFVHDPELGWGVVDAKCTALANRGEWHEAIPTYRLPQVAHYVRHTGLAWGGWAVCFGGEALEWWDVQAEQFDEVNAAIDDEVPRFIEHLNSDDPPTATPSPAMARVLAALQPVGRPRKRVAWTAPLQLDGKRWYPVEFDGLWAAAVVERKALDDHWGALQSVLRVAMGDATEVCLPNGSTYRIDRRGALRRYEKKPW